MLYCLIANDCAHVGLAVPGFGMIAVGTPPCGTMLYPGRPVWRTFDRAYRYLRWCPDLERMRVWGLGGDWDRDTYAYQDEPFNRTLRTLHVIAARH